MFQLIILLRITRRLISYCLTSYGSQGLYFQNRKINQMYCKIVNKRADKHHINHPRVFNIHSLVSAGNYVKGWKVSFMSSGP